jgi:ABC-type Fe3+/spermidine/putrescine transport system ATPase subunit
MRIELRSVCASYGRQVALRDVSLAVAEGELLALLGPSGSGKSTLLFVIAGLMRAGGRVLIDGQDVDRVPPRARGIGMVFQDLALWPHLGVAAHLRFVLDGAREHEDRIREILELTELGGLAQRLPSELSGGEAQRLALARALVARPRVLLLDEPLGALDRRLRDKMIGLVRQAHERYGPTTVLVTHDYDEALALADRVAVLHDGRLLQIGLPEQVYARPATVGAAEITGAVSILPGRRDGDRVALPFGTFRSEFAEGAAGPVSVVLRPESVEIGAGGGATVRASRFRGGRWTTDVEVGGVTVTGWSARRLETGSSVSLRLPEPLWSVGSA